MPFLPFLSQIHNLVRDLVSASAVTLLSDGELDTLALGQRDPGLVLANDENVALTGGEAVVNSILDVDDVETTVVALTVSDDTNTTHVTTTSDHNDGTGIELDEVGDLASGKLNLDGVVDLDQRIRNSRSCIVRDQEWDSTTTKLDTLDLAQLVLSLLGLNSVDGETALGIVDKTEVLASLLDGDDVHEAGGEGGIGSDLAVDLDKSLHQDGLDLTVVEGILEAVSDEDDQGHAVAELVRTGRRLGSVGAGQLVKQPVRGGAEALLVLLAIQTVRC
ncbi:hypothetical protein HG530_002151 [Fusarium avenaceum]|nr:hypothetical protein HG530_002151 [Fusarium avenaceum]